MNWDRLILYNLFLCFILLFTIPYIVERKNHYLTTCHINPRWAIITDKLGDKIEIEPTNKESWSVITKFSGKECMQLVTITGKIENYNNQWGYRFQPESIRLSWSGLIIPAVDLSSLPTIKYISLYLSYYLDNYIEIAIERIQGFDMKTTLGLTYNAYDFNYQVLQIVSLSLIGVCSFVICIYEIRLKYKKKKMNEFLATLN